MPRRPAAYPPAYREQIIALARAGRSSKELAQEFEPSEQTIRNWLVQAEADRGERPSVLTTDEREELSRLRRENRQLKVERDILGKAAAWFARESGTIPPDSSASCVRIRPPCRWRRCVVSSACRRVGTMRGGSERHPVALSVIQRSAWRFVRRTHARMRPTARHASSKIFGRPAIGSVRSGSRA